jgi:hypothetical protein
MPAADAPAAASVTSCRVGVPHQPMVLLLLRGAVGAQGLLPGATWAHVLVVRGAIGARDLLLRGGVGPQRLLLVPLLLVGAGRGSHQVLLLLGHVASSGLLLRWPVGPQGGLLAPLWLHGSLVSTQLPQLLLHLLLGTRSHGSSCCASQGRPP